MPKLRRMRLVSIGHDSARFSDVTLNFTDRSGRPTNSVVWLRNGGGKTSLLSLFFAGVRPNKREFLGQRAEAKIRSIDDYVGTRDHSVVVCEWELDAENSLFDDAAPRYLSGVFYQRSESHEENGKPDVDRLFFATMVSSSVAELSLDGLPLIAENTAQQHRRTLSGFRRKLNTLDSEHPQQNVFHSDKQHKFEEELASRGIDPEVFRYQVQMNDREGGVSERFSFAEDGDFIDFLLEMAFSQRRAREVREQLSTFRHELIERNEQLKPELEYCRGLIARLEKLVGVQRERAIVFQETSLTQQRLVGLKSWVSDRIASLSTETSKLESDLRTSQSGAGEARTVADRSHRAATVFHRQACQLRFNAINTDYEAAEKAHAEATRLKNIWLAARPLARSWEARRRAKLLREQLARNQQQHAPDLAKLQCTATEFANALGYHAAIIRKEEQEQRELAVGLTQAAETAQNESQAAGEQAVKQESRVATLKNKLQTAESELQLLRDIDAVWDEESADKGKRRLVTDMQSVMDGIADFKTTIGQKIDEQKQTTTDLNTAQKTKSDAEHQLSGLRGDFDGADTLRTQLETDAALLRLLQANEVDVESAAARAADTASEELRRITDAILRIQIEAAEDKRAMDWLKGDGELLPPSRDVEAILIWLRSHGVTAWSGWEYIERNKLPDERRALAERLPFVATGIVVANKDYEQVVDLIGQRNSAPRLQTALTIVPAGAISDEHAVTWTVIGPTSDGHFDRDAAARELNRLAANESQRTGEIKGHQEWQNDLMALRERLRAFQKNYPRGWFARHRQKIEVADAHLEEAIDNIDRIQRQLDEIQAALEQANVSRDKCRSRLSTLQRHLDRVEGFIRQHGTHVSDWTRELPSAERKTKQHRANQKRLKEQADKAAGEAKEREKRAQTLAITASQLEDEIPRLKYVDDAGRHDSPGQIESLRTDYQMLLDEYESKVNADALNQMAEAKDGEAEEERREFLRVLGRLSEIDANDVEVELSRMPKDTTAEIRAEQADKDENAALQRYGTLSNQWRPAKKDVGEATDKCSELLKTGEFPEVTLFESESENQEEAKRLDTEADEQSQLAAKFNAKMDELGGKLTSVVHEAETLEKDAQHIASLQTNHHEQFERLARHEADAEATPSTTENNPHVKDGDDLVRQIKSVESNLQNSRIRHQELDEKCDALSEGIADWSRTDRFGRLPTSISQRFVNKRSHQLEAKASFFITQLEDRVLEIERKLEEANKHHDRVVNIVLSAVDEGLSLLKRVSRMSRLPDSLPQAGKQFLVIETKASENPLERRAKVADLIDELLETGNVGDGLSLIQKAVRRVAVRTKVRVLHPDLHHSTQRISISAMRGLSGGERLTCAILLYCALVKLRQRDGYRKGSSVLILDNPIGTASRVSFLDLQREVAESMNVQLIYATGVKDLNAVGALENIIRLRNSRVDRRTGRRIVELDGDGEWIGRIDAARIVFDSAPSSVVSIDDEDREAVDSEMTDDVDHA